MVCQRTDSFRCQGMLIVCAFNLLQLQGYALQHYVYYCKTENNLNIHHQETGWKPWCITQWRTMPLKHRDLCLSPGIITRIYCEVNIRSKETSFIFGIFWSERGFPYSLKNKKQRVNCNSTPPTPKKGLPGEWRRN